MTIETEFNIGQSVYFMHDNKVQTAKIIEANITIFELNAQYCTTKSTCLYKLSFRASERSGSIVKEEKELFATKEDLWKDLIKSL